MTEMTESKPLSTKILNLTPYSYPLVSLSPASPPPLPLFSSLDPTPENPLGPCCSAHTARTTSPLATGKTRRKRPGELSVSLLIQSTLTRHMQGLPHLPLQMAYRQAGTPCPLLHTLYRPLR